MIAESAQGEHSEVERNCDQSARGLMPPAAGVRDARHLHRSILLLPGLMLAAAIAALLLALATGGGATPQALDDPGPVIRWGLPILKTVHNLAAAVTIGGLVLAVGVFSRRDRAFGITLDTVAAAAGVWAMAALGSLFFSALALTSTSILDPDFGDLLAFFVTTVDIGRAWALTTVIPASVTVIVLAFRGPFSVAGTLVISALALFPLTLTGHAGGSANHDAAVIGIALHLLGASVWLGGLVVLASVKSTMSMSRLATVIGRYSWLALASFIVVASSGAVSALLRLDDLAGLATPYGVILLGKVAILIALGVLGAFYRTRLIGRIRQGLDHANRLFWRIITVEIALMGLASGLAAGLARTPPPAGELSAPAPSPAEILTGRPTPPMPSGTTLLTQWEFDLFWALLCSFGVIIYLGGVFVLTRRGSSWPAMRTISWAAGWLLAFYLTNGSPAVYDQYLIGAVVVRYLGLAVAVPVLLVGGSPALLAKSTVETRDDGSFGIREYWDAIRRSRIWKILAQPFLAVGLLVLSLATFFFTSVLTWSYSSLYGREALSMYFVVMGCVAVRSVVASRNIAQPRTMRTYVAAGVLVTTALAGFALFLSMSDVVLAAEWFTSLELEWDLAPLQSQQLAGIPVWVLTGAVVLVGVTVHVARRQGEIPETAKGAFDDDDS